MGVESSAEGIGGEGGWWGAGGVVWGSFGVMKTTKKLIVEMYGKRKSSVKITLEKFRFWVICCLEWIRIRDVWEGGLKYYFVFGVFIGLF